jgi:hypothetical protein
MNLRTRTAVGLLPVLAASLSLGACSGSVSIGGDTVSKSEIESKATEALSAKVGQTPKSIVCPEDLDAKAGESEECTLTADDGTTIGVTATIESVSGDTVQFHFQVANKPN